MKGKAIYGFVKHVILIMIADLKVGAKKSKAFTIIKKVFLKELFINDVFKYREVKMRVSL